MTQGQPYGDIESVKTMSDVYAPLSGEVVRVNTSLKRCREDQRGPYGQGWFIEVRPANPSEVDLLLSAEEHEATIKA